MHAAERPHAITFPVALATWAVSWLVGNVVGSSIVGAATPAGSAATAPIWATAIAALCLWSCLLGGTWWTSRQYGTGSLGADVGWAWRTVDLVGVPIGVACQLVLLRVVYWPLERIWPTTFDADEVQRSARELVDRASGAWLVVLALVVVVGAPVVEEIVYRGLLQGAALRKMPAAVAVVLVAVWFALVHFRPVEYPGLFAFGLVLGVLAWRTRRLGTAVLAHAGFNAAGLAWVIWG